MVTISEKRPQSWRSAFTAAIIFVGATALTGGDELAVGAPFIAMHEFFGWWGGFFASVIIWLLAGFVSLAIVDFVWPKLKPLLQDFEKTYHWLMWPALIFGIVGLGALAYYFREKIYDLISLEFAGLLILAILFIFAVTVFVKLGDELVRSWVKKVTETTSNLQFILKPTAILAVLVYMGPVLSWALLSPLGITRKGIYWLTIVAAPLFTILWYPFYTGVWNTLVDKLL